MLLILGWIGAICLSLCAVPQVIRSIRTKKADDISAAFLILWLLGEFLTLIYVFPKFDFPLIANYMANIIFISIILRYKYA